MKTCISAILKLISSVLFYWRTRFKYACRKCCNRANSQVCNMCHCIKCARKIQELPYVGLPTAWEKK